MLYRYGLVIPANTPENAPVVQEIKLEPGIIHRVIVKFPPGCNQRVFFALFQGASKIFPTTPHKLPIDPRYVGTPQEAWQRDAMSGWFCGDGEEIPFEEHAVNKHGFHWFMKGYSPDTIYDHLVTVRIGILAEEDVTPVTLIKDLVGIFKRMLGVR